MRSCQSRNFVTIAMFFTVLLLSAQALAGGGAPAADFPTPLDGYGDDGITGLFDILAHRVKENPFNLAATIFFFCAICHTFLSSRLLALSHKFEHAHEEKKANGLVHKESKCFWGGVFHFLGEVEAIFGLWAIPLAIGITMTSGWHTVVDYVGHTVNFTEPIFVVVIMTIAASRPILKLSELLMWRVAELFGGMLGAWWLTILTLGPILGSLITEPAAMTISAMLLAEKLYDLDPPSRFKYGTIGLLFVNVSVGGTLTNFAAPPVLMVAAPWDWSLMDVLIQFGWKAVLGIGISNAVYFYIFRNDIAKLQEKYAIVKLKRELQFKHVDIDKIDAEFERLEVIVAQELGFANACDLKCKEMRDRLHEDMMLEVREKGLDVDHNLLEEAFDARFEEFRQRELARHLPGLLPEEQRPDFHDPRWDERDDHVPILTMVVHALFMLWTVMNAHYPPLVVAGLLFYLGFTSVTPHLQNRVNLKPSLLVGFFLAGLVIHGGLQGWWIEPVLKSLSEVPLLLGSTILTAFNDNAAITYLSTLVPDFTDSLKYAVVAGAVSGGGLTVIANAPNPAGQSILKKYFEDGVNPGKLAFSALFPTIVVVVIYIVLAP